MTLTCKLKFDMNSTDSQQRTEESHAYPTHIFEYRTIYIFFVPTLSLLLLIHYTILIWLAHANSCDSSVPDCRIPIKNQLTVNLLLSFKLFEMNLVATKTMGDEFTRRLCDPLHPVIAVLYYDWLTNYKKKYYHQLAAGLHNKIISQGVGGHRVYVGIRHPKTMK